MHPPLERQPGQLRAGFRYAFGNAAISSHAWWWVLTPGICVVLVVHAFTLVGRSLEAVLDPRLQER